jgi:hypothetical protein
VLRARVAVLPVYAGKMAAVQSVAIPIDLQSADGTADGAW